MRNIRYIIILVLLSIIFSSALLAIGIAADPGATLSYVKVFGVEAPLPSFFIINVNAEPMKYTLGISPGSRLTGYMPLPERDWVKLAFTETTLAAYDTIEVPIFISVPDMPENYNRAWAFNINIRQVGLDNMRGMSTVELALRLNWFVETKSVSQKLPDKNDEPISLSPAVWFIKFQDYENTRGQAVVQIRNDDEVRHTYFFKTHLPFYGDELMGQKLDVIPLVVEPDWWIPDEEWVMAKPDKFLFFNKAPKISLDPGESVEKLIKFDIPAGLMEGNTYEALVFIKPEGSAKNCRFIRFIFR